MNRSAADGAAGFTLAEALVSLVIVSLGLAALFSAFTTATDGLWRSGQRQQALAMARTLIDEAGTVRPLSAGIADGVSPAGLGWRLVISERPGPPTLRSLPAVTVFRVEAQVFLGAQTLSLSTLKVKQGP